MIRTDLAHEAHELISKDKASQIDGIALDSIKYKYGELVRLEIKNKKSEEIIGKKIGKYFTYETNSFRNVNMDLKKEVINSLVESLQNLLKIENERILIVGLGNRNITADSLGPKVVDKIKITRHIFKAYDKDYDEDFNEVAAVTPGVMGITGIETINTIKGVIDKIHPTMLIAIDSLASRKMRRLCSVIQLTDAGIEPGSGIGNVQGSINEETTGIKVAAIGVPTVIDTATIVNDTIELMHNKIRQNTDKSDDVIGILGQLSKTEKQIFIKEILSPLYGDTYVTPNEIDELIETLSDIISSAINIAIHKGMTVSDIKN